MATNKDADAGWDADVGLNCFDLVDMISEEDSSTLSSFTFFKSPPARAREGPAQGGSRDGDHEVPPKKPVSDADCSTPRVKSKGVYGSSARRRLTFSPEAVGSQCQLETWGLGLQQNLQNFLGGTEKAPVEIPKIQGVEEESRESTAAECPESSEAMEVNSSENTFFNIVMNQAGNNSASSIQGPVFQEHPPAQVPQPPKPSASVVSECGNRRIAQLVVWTKNSSKPQLLKKTEIVKVLKDLPPPPVPIPCKVNPVATASSPLKITGQDSSEKVDPVGDLFIVQYPVRPLTETSKNKGKGKAQKRARRPSPGSPSKPEFKKKSRKQKRSSSSLVQGTSTGRAYRTYLHSCLEKQRQQLRFGADFKVEKLFQPDQGIALPGEILPAVTEPTATTCSSVLQTPTPAGIPVPSIASSNNPPTLSFSNQPIVLPSEGQLAESSTASVTAAPHISDPSPFVTSAHDSSDNICIPSCSIVTSTVEGTGEFIPLFELPDRFTVTTEPNEFDLLIQNFIREEMVGPCVEDEEMAKSESERCRKRMKISNSSSRASSEERMAMDEPGKPRCTYTELIEKALTEAGGLTVSEIYNWISERYPFFKPDDDRWKNSVRHNLSINPYFKKGEKARNGAGHLWTISEESKGLRPAMVSWDERRKSPSSDPSDDFIMPIESETDRAVANILGKYISEVRANREESKMESGDENGRKNVRRDEVGPGMTERAQTPSCGNEEGLTFPSNQEETQKVNEPGATCDTSTEQTTFNLSELNSGQFTVDLSGITIPEGGSINFEELINNGRLIYIQTDPEANKENESAQGVVLNECMLSELTALTSNSAQDDARFHSFYSDTLSLESLGFGKGSDSIATASYDTSQLSLNTCTTSTAASTFTPDTIDSSTTFQQDIQEQLVHPAEIPNESHNQADLTVMDQVITMSSYDGTVMQENLPAPVLSSAALYESKELGISYTYQTESCTPDILQ